MRQLKIILACTLLLSVVAVPTVAASQNGQTVVVAEGETVKGLSATAERVVVRGTVDGNLRAQAASVVIAETATVTGRVRAVAGTVTIAGDVGGNVVAYAGNVDIARTAHIRKSVGAVSGNVDIAGDVDGDVIVGAGTVVTAGTAHIAGDLNYQGNHVDEGGTIEGEVRRSADLNLLPGVPRTLLAGYLLFAELLFGALLLAAAPAGIEAASNTLRDAPREKLGAGAAAAVVTPVLALVFAATIVGLPIALAVLSLLVVGIWTGTVVVRYTLGRELLRRVDREHRWGALVLGVGLVAGLAYLPYVGWLVRVVVAVAGLGALVMAARGHASALRGE